MEQNDLIMVDIFDNKIGNISKADAHKRPILHRAFSVFLFDDNKLLIQQRAFGKYHSAGLWANTCCSHPRTDNVLFDAKIRLKEEVGISCDNLSELFCFTYLTKFSNDLFEYEYDHVIVGKYCGGYEINKDEVNDMKWVDVDVLAKDMVKNPQIYASWFLICAPKVIEYIKGLEVNL
jgi:isopentenyl-diphosphate delta-isomerase